MLTECKGLNVLYMCTDVIVSVLLLLLGARHCLQSSPSDTARTKHICACLVNFTQYFYDRSFISS